MVRFSATKEVGWEADDEDESHKSDVGVQKHYRFPLDFSRGSSKGTPRRKKGSLRFKSPKGGTRSSDWRNSNTRSQHLCCGCGKTRCPDYQEQYPLWPGKKSTPNLCRGCRQDRKVRLHDSACDGNRRRKVSELQVYIDRHHWCSSCGRARSDEYHGMYQSANLPPWLDKCTAYLKNSEKKQDSQRLRMYEQEMVAVGSRSDETLHDPLRDSVQHRWSSPYAITPDSSRIEFYPVSSTTPGSDFSTKADDSNTSSGGQQPSVESRGATDASYLATDSSTVRKTSDNQSTSINSRKTTVEKCVSDDNHSTVRPESKQPQATGKHQHVPQVQLQPQKRSGSQEKQPMKRSHHLRQDPASGAPVPSARYETKGQHVLHDAKAKHAQRAEESGTSLGSGLARLSKSKMFHDLHLYQSREGYEKREKHPEDEQQSANKAQPRKTPAPAADPGPSKWYKMKKLADLRIYDDDSAPRSTSGSATAPTSTRSAD
ncbi:hypothetical protein VTI74DRAFT_5379 [Chaetomium olivicolor]